MDTVKLNRLEALSDKGMIAETKVAVVNLLVSDWGYIHTDACRRRNVPWRLIRWAISVPLQLFCSMAPAHW